jgi:hypothetical protein
MAGDRDNRDDAVVSPARQLDIFERLLAIQDTSLAAGLTRAADLVASALGADKTDALLLDPASDSLVAVGTSRTPDGPAAAWDRHGPAPAGQRRPRS